MVDHTQKHTVTRGTLLKAVGFRSEPSMTFGKTYEAIGVQEGIFHDRPYVVLLNDYGMPSTWHLSRFELVEESNDA